MDGKELFKKYTQKPTEYARLLMTMYTNIGSDLYPILEKAEKEGKKLGTTPEPKDYLRDELSPEDIILI